MRLSHQRVYGSRSTTNRPSNAAATRASFSALTARMTTSSRSNRRCLSPNRTQTCCSRSSTVPSKRRPNRLDRDDTDTARDRWREKARCTPSIKRRWRWTRTGAHDGKRIQRWAEAIDRTVTLARDAEVRAFEQGSRPATVWFTPSGPVESRNNVLMEFGT